MVIIIRPGKISDLKAIQDLNLMLFKKEVVDYDPLLDCAWPHDRRGTQYFTDRLTKPGNFLAVAENEAGKLVGYLSGGLEKSEDFRKPYKLAELADMIVLPECRGQGVGGKLVGAFLNWCRQNKVAVVKVVAFTDNVPGLKFYKAHGFQDYDTTLELKLN